ncbi:DgyrCDS5433 [Dimorphilus gyrociliatus]|uniref:DgyrCDS5433 n=1 Tax=Dimorphilus gyrociliatus TaxID=2664684 RepID=A0A7I8VJU7_9ANNE|nr:DgyrCDS5433 [Dimorphilus gyrociliatus]
MDNGLDVLPSELDELIPAATDDDDIGQLIDAVESLSNDPAFVSSFSSSIDFDNFPNLEPVPVTPEEPPRQLNPTPAPIKKPSATATIQINSNVISNASAIQLGATPNQVVLPKVGQSTPNNVIQGQQIIINGANLPNIPLQQINIASLLPNKTLSVRPQQTVQPGSGGNIIVRAIQPNIILQPQQLTQVLLTPNSTSSQSPQQIILAQQPVSNCPTNTQPIVVEPQNTNINLINVGNLNFQGYNLQSVNPVQPNLAPPRQPLQIVANNGVPVPIRSQLQDHLGLKQKLIVVTSAPPTSSVTVRCLSSATLASSRNFIPQTSQTINTISSTSTDPNIVKVVPSNNLRTDQQQIIPNSFQNTGNNQPSESPSSQPQAATLSGSSTFSKPQLERIVNHLKNEINSLSSKQPLGPQDENKLAALRDAHEAIRNKINDPRPAQPSRPIAQVPPNVTISQASPFPQKSPILQKNIRIQQSTRPVNIVPANNVCTSQPVKTEPLTITIQKGTATQGIEANHIKLVNNKLILPPSLEERIKRLPEDKQMKVYRHFINEAQGHINNATNFQNANVTLPADLGATPVMKLPIVTASATMPKTFATPTQPVKKTTVQATTPVQMAHNQLLNDHKFALNPEIKEPFKDIKDVCRRLVRYHVFQHRMPQKEVLAYDDECFEGLSQKLLAKKEQLQAKFHMLMLEESMRRVPSAEMVLIGRMFINNEKTQLEEDKLRVNRSSPTFFPTPRLADDNDELSYNELRNFFVPIKEELDTEEYVETPMEEVENFVAPDEDILPPFPEEDLMLQLEDRNIEPPEPKRPKVEESASMPLESIVDDSVQSTNGSLELDAAVQSILN